MSRSWQLRPATPDDVEWLADLRAVVLRDNLVRLGHFDELGVRQRFRNAFVPGWTSVIVVDGADAGCIALRPDDADLWLEHFYLSPALQGQGIGGDIVTWAVREAGQRVLRLSVLTGSRAELLYARHGFVVTGQDDVDLLMARQP